MRPPGEPAGASSRTVSGAGHPALARLVRVPPEEFAERFWSRGPLLSPGGDLPAPFTDLLSAEAVDELVSERGLRTPFLRLAKDGSTLPERAFTRGGGVGAGITDQVSDDLLLRHFADGTTLVLQGLHRTWAPIARFTRELAQDLGHPVQANAYVTPPQSTGFSDHYDVHDVFVLQVEGEKRWRVRPPVAPLPLRDEPWTQHRRAVEEAARAQPLLEATLRPGDCLYLPRGYLHAATALGEQSIHLTLGVHPWARQHLAEDLARAALRHAGSETTMRQALALGADLLDPSSWEDDFEQARAALLQALASLTPADVAPDFGRRWVQSQRAAPVRPLAQARAAATLQAEQRLDLRPHLAANLHLTEGGEGVLTSRAGEVRIPAAGTPGVQRLLRQQWVGAGDLGVELARILLVHGVVVPG